MTAPLTPERLAEAQADLATVSDACGSAVAWSVTHDPLGTHVEHGCGRGRLVKGAGADHPYMDREALARLLASVPELLAEVERLTERAEAAEAALARVAGLVALEESTPGAVDGLLSSIREAMQTTTNEPTTPKEQP